MTTHSSTEKPSSTTPKRRRGIWLLVVLVVGLALLGAGYRYFENQLDQPLHPGKEAYLVAPGDTLLDVANTLKSRGVTDNTWPLILWARWQKNAHRIKAGEYHFPDEITLKGLLDQLVAGKVVKRSVTFLEGWTFKQFRAKLNDITNIRHVTAKMSDQEVMSALGYPDQYPEGRFFPSTYQYFSSHSDLKILEIAYRLMDEELAKAWESRDKNIPLETPYQALILASIIEKESTLQAEQPIIAGVFYNRLKINMRLQTDPTVIYGLGDKFDGNLKRIHLKTDNPYNTYTRFGLPPTPIAMPSAGALNAAVRPESTKAFYFVADGSGGHAFSETLKQHNNAVRKFQLNREK